MSLDSDNPNSQEQTAGAVGEGRQGRVGLAGTIIGQFRLVRELGHGAQGYVYLAEDEKLHRQVAIKILVGISRESAKARIRFEREAEAASKLDHPGIARVFEVGVHEEMPYIVFEYVKGKTLQRFILESAERSGSTSQVTEVHFGFDSLESSETTDENQHDFADGSNSCSQADQAAITSAVRFTETAARALFAAHESGLIHRDIKPGNLIVREDGSACILDFGLARDEASDDATLTQSGDLMGTPSYMSPEQLLAHRIRLDHRTDIYSLGVTLYEACTLQRPFEEPSRQELYYAISQREPASPRKVNPRVPKDLASIILTAIDKDRDRRYATAELFADDLRRFLNKKPVLARPAGPMTKSLRWAQRNPGVAVLAVALFLATSLSALVFYFKNEESQEARRLALHQKSVAENATRLAKEESRKKSRALEAETRERQAKEEALRNYERLADVKRVELMRQETALLHPPGPDLLPKLAAWDSKYEALLSRAADHRAYLAELESKAEPYLDKDRQRDFRAEIEERRTVKARLKKVREMLRGTGNTGDIKTVQDEETVLVERIKVLDETLKGRRTFQFGDRADLSLQHEILSKLVKDLEFHASHPNGYASYVKRTREQSERILNETVLRKKDAWQACANRVKKNPAYGGLELKPQIGLIPLGPDPNSGLEEFVHWLSHIGPLPNRRNGKSLKAEEAWGIILVLVPGGTYKIGSQKSEPDKENFDPHHRGNEAPVHEVKVAHFFLAKHELTQAQWLRMHPENPSAYPIGGTNPAFKKQITALHPVERISWTETRNTLRRFGLCLPTEAEWERAARAGKSDLVFAGTSKVADLRRFANIKGKETVNVRLSEPELGHEDDFIVHSPVGSFAPNAWGFHDMTGNVSEWCEDVLLGYENKVVGPRSLRVYEKPPPSRVIRGGNFFSKLSECMVAARGGDTVESQGQTIGVRPARLIE